MFGIIDRVRSWFGGSPSRAVRERLIERMFARYDAATTNAENKNHWLAADGMSARAANSLSVRKTLRNRSRYECANNCYANGMTRTLAYHCVGTGPTLAIEGETPFDREVETKWAAWCVAVNLPEKLRVMREARARDGEAFGLITRNDAIDHPVKMDFQLTECDQVTDPAAAQSFAGGETARNYADGITFDAQGNPTTYVVLKDHPGDPWFRPDKDDIAAKFVCHWFRSDRPGQRRGIPELTPALPLYAVLRRYTMAVLGSAEVAAMMSLFLKTTSASIDPASVDPYDLIDVQRNSMMTLPDGWDVQQLKAEQPTTTHDSFCRTILREIARCLDMPYNIAVGDSSSYNYSSGRLDHQTYFRAIEVDRDSCERQVLAKIFREWFDDALLTDGLFTEPRTELGRPVIGWDWPPFEHVDPEKEANATTTDLEIGLTSIPTELAKRGKRWDREWTKQARALGMTLAAFQQRMADKLFAPKPPQQQPAAADRSNQQPTEAA